MTERFAFRIPRRCPICATDQIRLAQTIKGPLVHLGWQCSGCQHEWPVSSDDRGDRRIGDRRLTMRKRLPPKDRRTA